MAKKFEISDKASLSLIKRLTEIYKFGYVPARGSESYFHYVDDNAEIKSGELANCFEHACFNLKNKHFEELDISYREALNAFGNFAGLINLENNQKSIDQIEHSLIAIVKKVGLRMRKSSLSSILKPNEWKVALYFAEDPSSELKHDYHFFLQERNGDWSCKVGWTHSTQVFDKLPKEYKSEKLIYTKKQIYTIANPFIDLEK